MDPRLKDILEMGAYILLGYLIAVGALKGLSYGLKTDYPAVSVITTSMEHDNPEETYVSWMLQRNYTRQDLKEFSFPSGLRRGDMVIVVGNNFGSIEPGDVIVYNTDSTEPIIHRVVSRNETVLYTKGDNNRYMDQNNNAIAPPINEEYYQGKAVFHMPILGYVKVAVMKLQGKA
ncbi:MAG: signal peptidase I [Candidatus Undinarchaeales archaeon]